MAGALALISAAAAVGSLLLDVSRGSGGASSVVTKGPPDPPRVLLRFGAKPDPLLVAARRARDFVAAHPSYQYEVPDLVSLAKAKGRADVAAILQPSIPVVHLRGI